MSVLKERPRRRPEVNIIPLVDVLVVLIFFFLISMQFRNLSTLELTLPKVETAGQSKINEQLEIAITASGELYLYGESVTEEQLIARLRETAQENREMPVLLIVDEESALRHVTRIMDLSRKEGLDRIRLQSR